MPYTSKQLVMNLSLVIPVYNEAAYLDACLSAVAKQTIAPLEVLVVDNNSDDNSRQIAQRYDFVRILSEPRQGVVYARNHGFDAARGDIICRIDADTILPPSWLEKVAEIFQNAAVDAVSGAADYYDFGLPGLANSVDGRARSWLARQLNDKNFLWGANMAVRAGAWRRVRNQLCCQANLHEDFDLAIHLQEAGFVVDYEGSLIAGVSSRRVDTKFVDYIRYSLVSPKTYAMHQLSIQHKMYPILMVCWLIYLPARLIYRSYDIGSNSFSLAQLFTPRVTRIDPTTNIV